MSLRLHLTQMFFSLFYRTTKLSWFEDEGRGFKLAAVSGSLFLFFFRSCSYSVSAVIFFVPAVIFFVPAVILFSFVNVNVRQNLNQHAPKNQQKSHETHQMLIEQKKKQTKLIDLHVHLHTDV